MTETKNSTLEPWASLPDGWVVYHRDEAGQPDAHDGGPWFYAPTDYDSADVYSYGYATRDDAIEAAEREAEESEREAELESTGHG